MNLEIKSIFSPDLSDGTPPDPFDFRVLLSVSIGEKEKAGAEVFYFLAASPTALENEVNDGEYLLMHSYILMRKFDWQTIRTAIENIIDHSRHLETWGEVVSYFERYATSDYSSGSAAPL